MCSIVLLTAGSAFAGSISTLADLKADGGISLNAAGDIYAADFGPLGAAAGPRNVWKLSPSGAFAPFIFASGIIVASGNDVDSQGNLFQSNFGADRISKIDPAGNVTSFSTSVRGPVGIVIDENDNVYVNNCGGGTISKITPQGVASTFSTSGVYSCLNGITQDDQGNLFVINWNDGRIFKIAADGVPVLFASVPPQGGHLAIAGGRLFATSYGANTVTAFTLSGPDAGTLLFTIGSGQLAAADGTFSTGGFNRPNGIAANAAEELLYVTDQRGVRIIDLEDSDIALSRESIDFGNRAVGDTVVRSVEVSNNGIGDLVFSAIGLSSATDINISADTCTGMSVASGGNCSLSIFYMPQAEGALNATLDITSNDPDRGVIAIPVTGMAMAVPAPNIVDPGDIDVGDLIIGGNVDISLPLENSGVLTLNIASLSLAENGGTPGTVTESFTVTETCTVVAAGATCFETLSYHPTSSGDKSALLEIASDDPETPKLQIMVFGTASTDSDGVSDAVENGALNAGDGNSDGTADSAQADVTSLPDTNNVYLTLVSVDNLALTNVAAIANPASSSAPANANFDQGFISISITGVPATAVSVYIILAAGAAPDRFFNYGGEPANTADHWYDFASDGATGASFNGNTVTLSMIDGGRGDADQTADGVIVVLGGTATTPTPPPPAPPPPVASGGGGGAFGGIFLLTLGLGAALRRRRMF